MTTIVYRDGVMAADSRAYAGNKQPLGFKTKIFRLADGSLFGASSSKVGQCDKLRRMVEDRGTETIFDKEVAAQGILVKPNGDVFYFNDQDAWSGPIQTDCAAIGSGEEYAMGALKMGASAEKAVQIAIECDVWSGGPITVMALAES